ncbi:unnamed protein product [Cunninghamella echinulata]
MLFSKLLVSALSVFATANAIDNFQKVLGSEINSQQAYNDIVTIDDFRILRDEKVKGYQVRLKHPTICNEGLQYSGYIDNLEHDDHFFFWFFESRSSPKDDPLVLWLNGGPGCSSLMGELMELGPCRVNEHGNDTVSNPYSWNAAANVIFLEQPVNVGYSYGKTKVKSSTESARDVYAFLQIFLSEFKEYAKSPFHISGESYGGHYEPALAVEIIKNNKFAEQHDRLRINLESVAIGNGWTDPLIQFKYYKDFGCAENDSPYQPFFDKETCAQMEKTYPHCETLSKACYKFPSRLTCIPSSLYCEKHQGGEAFAATGLNPYDIRRKCEGDNGLCYNIIGAVEKYANLPHVRAALGADSQAGNYTGCSDKVGTRFSLTGDNSKNFEPHIVKTLSEDVRVLLYVGDKDYICNWMGNKAWALSMDWAGQEGFNNAKDEPWLNKKTGEKAGELRKYKNLSFLKVYDAGHMVPFDQPANALEFFNRWLKNDL